jgi:hypothetical protein
MATAAPVQRPIEAEVAQDPPTEDYSSSENESVESAESSQDSESSDDETNLMGLAHDLEDMGTMAPPNNVLGNAIVDNIQVQAVERDVNIDGITWEPKEHIAVDVVTQSPRQPQLQWSRAIRNTATDPAAPKDILDCFRLFFPEKCVETILNFTNQNINSDLHKTGDILNRGELLRYFGIRLAMAIDPCGGPIDDFWKIPSEEHEETIRQCRNYGQRFFMSKNRFKCIERNLQYCAPVE